MLWQIHGEPKDSSLRFSTSGDNIILAAPTSGNMFIHVLGLLPSADVTIKIKCGSRTVADYDLKQYQPYAIDDMPGQDGTGTYVCKTGENFVINLGSAVQVTGQIKYSYTDTTV